MAQPPTLACPTCGRPVQWSQQYPFRPFCSERCKLIDLGAWLSEERRIPGQEGASQGSDTPDED